MVNSVHLLGNLGRDVELAYTPNSVAVAKLNVATSKVWYKEKEKHEKTTWHTVKIFGKQAENCSQYLKKGSKVFVEGEIDNRSYDNKDGVKVYVSEIIASNVQFLDRNTESETTNKPQSKPAGKDPDNLDSFFENNKSAYYTADELPF